MMAEGGAAQSEPSGKKATREPREAPGIGRVVLHVAWLAILLGLTVQILLLIVATISGQVHNLRPFISGLVQTISWSVLVCAGIAIGATISKLRLELTGLAGLLSAPVAFKVARSLQKGVSAALGLPVGGAGGPSPFVLGLIKALEYGALALAVSWIATHTKGTARAYALAGACVGIFFGAIALSYLHISSTHGLSRAELLSRGINELLFPIGCSLVLFAASAMATRLKAEPR
jgi:hypothetical protein